MDQESPRRKFGEIFSVHFTPDDRPDEDLGLASVWYGKSFDFMMASSFTTLRIAVGLRFILLSEQHCQRGAYSLPNHERLPDTHISHLTRVLSDRDHH